MQPAAGNAFLSSPSPADISGGSLYPFDNAHRATPIEDVSPSFWE
jgi:hypothetical protein